MARQHLPAVASPVLPSGGVNRVVDERSSEGMVLRLQGFPELATAGAQSAAIHANPRAPGDPTLASARAKLIEINSHHEYWRAYVQPCNPAVCALAGV
jgi:hypothetical protein